MGSALHYQVVGSPGVAQTDYLLLGESADLLLAVAVAGEDVHGVVAGDAAVGSLGQAGLVEVEKLADGDAEGFGLEAERGGMRGAKAALGLRAALGEGEE